MIRKQVRILGIIPARGGSKGIPGKNIALVAGKPLIYYTIREAKKSKLLDAFLISTDDLKIAAVAESLGAEAPFLRPKSISGDHSTDIEFMRHALGWVKKNRGWDPEYLVNLRPTSPLRTADDIDRAIAVALKGGCDLVKSVSAPGPYYPYKMWMAIGKNPLKLKPILITKHYKKIGTDVPRQLLPDVYWQNGLADVVRSVNVKTGKLFTGEVCGVITDPKKDLDINEPVDLERLVEILSHR